MAAETRGVNVNILAADGPDAIERISGMTKLTGLAIEVELAATDAVETAPTSSLRD